MPKLDTEMLSGYDSTLGSKTLYESQSGATAASAPATDETPTTMRHVRYSVQGSSSATVASPVPPPRPTPSFSKSFFRNGDAEVARARKIYLKVWLMGLLMVIIVIFVVFSIYWGSLWKVPAHALKGWIVDFDGGEIGQSVIDDLMASKPAAQIIKFHNIPPTQFVDGVAGVIEAVKHDQTWVAIVINQNASSRLQEAISTPIASYDGSAAITLYAAEARNENAYRTFIRPVMQSVLDGMKMQYAMKMAGQLASSSELPSLMATSPQTVINPISYTIANLLPFDQPVASAVTFVGLIYLLILSFFIVVVAYGAREASGVNHILSLKSLIAVRLLSSTLAYGTLSLFYSLLNVAFKLHFTRRYGHAGFIIFWMLNWIGMLSVGLALESLITILTVRFIPFFLIFWIILDVSVSVYPLDMIPRIYHYGYAAPFYNVSNSVRSIVFGTRNTLGLNFGVLLAWVLISFITLPILQWYVRRGDIRRAAEASRITSGVERKTEP